MNISRFVKYIFLLLTVSLAGCTDDFLSYLDGSSSGPELNVTCEIAGFSGMTRSLGDQPTKTQFSDGNSIHISAEFKLSDGTTSEGYAVMVFNGGRWTQIEQTSLFWPDNAVGGTFRAYYMPGNQDDILGDSSQGDVEGLSGLLSGIKTDDDPLVSDEVTVNKYGEAINFKFKHLCTYLTLVNLEPGVPTLSYWFTRPNPQDQLTFNNAYRLVREGTKLKFEFFQSDKSIFESEGSDKELVYIMSDIRDYVPEGAPEGTASDLRAGFFLQPGLYDTFTIQYPGALKPVPYLSYNHNDIPSAEESKIPQLEAGCSYILDIRKSQGIVIAEPEDEETWDDSEAVEINVRDFLEAANQGRDYDIELNGETVRILEALDNGAGVKLKRNVDFKFKEYTFFPEGGNYTFFNDFSKTFDGGHHKIINLASPLFHSNSSSGVVKNLWLQTIRANNITSDKVLGADGISESQEDFSSIGIICGKNEGDLINIRVDDLQMTVNIKSDARSEVHNIGCLVGANNGGDLHDIELMGKFALTVQNSNASENQNENGDNTTLYIGGLIGQIAGRTEIDNIGPYSADFSMKIVNTCDWNGPGNNQRAYYIGGLMGMNSGFVSNITVMNIDIDSSRSAGQISFIGGIAGSLEASTDSEVSDCVVSGSLRAGKITTADYLLSYSGCGGVAGRLQGVKVKDCRSTFNVYGSTDEVYAATEANVTYATGGAFGAVLTEMGGPAASNFVKGVVAYGSVLQGLSVQRNYSNNGVFLAYTGSFAGIVPEGETWTDYSDNALVRIFPSIPMIGNVATRANPKPRRR